MKIKFSNLWSAIDFLVGGAVRSFEALLGPGTGAEKRKQAVAWLMDRLRPSLPDWMEPIVEFTIGFLLDALVAKFNRDGWPLGLAPAKNAPAGLSAGEVVS